MPDLALSRIDRTSVNVGQEIVIVNCIVDAAGLNCNVHLRLYPRLVRQTKDLNIGQEKGPVNHCDYWRVADPLCTPDPGRAHTYGSAQAVRRPNLCKMLRG